MKFIADINVSRRIVEGLCSAGHDAIHVSAILDCRVSDRQILEEARHRDAVVISHDQDFTAILAVSGAAKPSLLNLRITYVDAARILQTILSVIEVTHQELSSGAIVTIDDRGARIHQLPIR